MEYLKGETSRKEEACLGIFHFILVSEAEADTAWKVGPDKSVQQRIVKVLNILA